MDVCVFCDQSLDDGQDTVLLREKGSNSINKSSIIRNDVVVTKPGQKVHQDCRRDYTNQNTIKKDLQTESTMFTPEPCRDLRSSSEAFQFDKNCLFCGKQAKYSDRKRGIDVFPVRTIDFSKILRELCCSRNDEWADIVQRRLNLSPTDLHAADAIYHQTCSVNFRTGKQLPVSKQENKENKRTTPGRPKEDQSEKAFTELITFLEHRHNEPISITELVKKMEEMCGERAFSAVHMKKRLQAHFGSDIFISEINGKANVVTFRRTVSSVLNEFHSKPCYKNPEEEKLAIIKTAANLIKADIMCIKCSKSEYPSPVDLQTEKNENFLPESLQVLLKGLFSETDCCVKVASVGQAIMQATRPRTLIAPLQISLGVQMHHHFGSRFLLDTLNSLGFASSYTEVQKFELNAAASHNKNELFIGNNNLVQFVADNVDHNLRTLDGHGTFHGMGMIAAVTPGQRLQRPVPRRSPTLQEVIQLAKINIVYYKGQPNQSFQLEFEKLNCQTPVIDQTWKLDLLSKVCWTLTFKRPTWSAIMQKMMDNEFPGKSSIVFMPMIDMNPNDLTCINSTLHFVGKEAKAHNFKPILTFDQPLYWKAMQIIEMEPNDSPLKSTILRLGGFHLEMSFAGCIGHLMDGSGLSELLETVYASNAVSHMLSGKAIARAVRGYFLTDTALTSLMLSHIYNIPLQDSEEATQIDEYIDQNTKDTELLDADKMLEKLINKEATVGEVCQDHLVDRIKSKLEQFRTSHRTYCTSNLWFQFMDMVDILRRFIKAERIGDWKLHLNSINEMLPYLAVAGHNNYVKSARVYLQQMNDIEVKHPDVSALFKSGYHVIRRSDRFSLRWSAI